MVRSKPSNVEPLQTFRWGGSDKPSEAVILAIAEELEEDPLAMEPLRTVVDPDALDSMFSPTHNSPRRANGSIRFEYHGLVVVVEADGVGHIYRQESDLTRS